MEDERKQGRRGAKERREIAPVKRINLTVRGEPAQWLEEWIREGCVTASRMRFY